MKTTLVIMAAGIGSRFGGGIKQLAPVGLNGEIIMDYSIHDAIEAGFNKIVFIIRKDIEDAFKEAIGDRIEEICKKLSACEDIWFATNIEIYDYVEAYKSLHYSADGHKIFNPSLFTVYLDVDGTVYSVKSGETIRV